MLFWACGFLFNKVDTVSDFTEAASVKEVTRRARGKNRGIRAPMCVDHAGGV